MARSDPGPGTEPDVLAAGGLVVREGCAGPELCVVHRPKYGDWSLPKGKLDPGESFEEAALREVEEETGFRCSLGEALAPARYRDRKGRDKLVRYFLMKPIEGAFAPNAEVDELRWLAPDEARALLSHEHDRRLIWAVG